MARVPAAWNCRTRLRRGARHTRVRCFRRTSLPFRLSARERRRARALFSRTTSSCLTGPGMSGSASSLLWAALVVLFGNSQRNHAGFPLPGADTRPFGLMFTRRQLVGDSRQAGNYTRLQTHASSICSTWSLRSAGRLIGEYALQTRVWRWLGLFVPLALPCVRAAEFIPASPT